MAVDAQKVKAIIKEAEDRIDTSNMKDDIPLTEQGVDSLDIAAIFLQIEEELDITVPDQDVPKLRTINDIVDYINKQ